MCLIILLAVQRGCLGNCLPVCNMFGNIVNSTEGLPIGNCLPVCNVFDNIVNSAEGLSR